MIIKNLFQYKYLLAVPILFASFFISDNYIDKLNDSIELYIFGYTLIACTFYSLVLLLKKEKTVFRITTVDALIILYGVFISVRLLSAPHWQYTFTSYLLECCVLCWYFIFRVSLANDDKNTKKTLLLVVITLVAFVHAIISMLQYFGFHNGFNPQFKVQGLFGNPSSLSNFIAPIIPVTVFLLWKAHKAKLLWNSLILVIALVVMCFVVVVANARASWFALVICVGIIVYLLIIRRVKNKAIRLGIIMVSALLFLFGGLKAYNLKKDSANGRLIIWKICLANLDVKPLFGNGYGKFNSTYNNYQANFLNESKLSDEEKYLVSDGFHAFNEFIQKQVELGLTGLLIWIAIWLIALVNSIKSCKSFNTNEFTFMAGMAVLVLMLLSMFSYPFSNYNIYITGMLFAAIITTQMKTVFSILLNTWFIKSIVVILIGSMVWALTMAWKYNNSLKEWSLANTYIKINREKALEKYDILAPELKYNPKFLYNYGVQQMYNEAYTKAIEILTPLAEVYNDSETHLYLGICYLENNELIAAKQHFAKAIEIVPYLVVPRYFLVKTYLENNEKLKALKLATETTNMRIKVYNKSVEKSLNGLYIIIDELNTALLKNQDSELE